MTCSSRCAQMIMCSPGFAGCTTPGFTIVLMHVQQHDNLVEFMVSNECSSKNVSFSEQSTHKNNDSYPILPPYSLDFIGIHWYWYGYSSVGPLAGTAVLCRALPSVDVSFSAPGKCHTESYCTEPSAAYQTFASMESHMESHMTSHM